ncbi:MAG: hypothetical protein HGA67_01105 [Candidatus Yonathbacteria bacterium]|nr:hypothetical protein [Candidatus Yonathbacteria bacterium]
MQQYPGKQYHPDHHTMSEMAGSVLPVANLKRRGFELVGLESFKKEVVSKVNGHNPVVTECLASAKTALGNGVPILLVCAVIRDKNLPGDMVKKRTLMVYPTNGDIKHLSVSETVASTEGPQKKTETIKANDSFHLEHLSHMLPEGCNAQLYQEQFDNWVCILCIPKNLN